MGRRILMVFKRSILDLVRARERVAIDDSDSSSTLLALSKVAGNLADRHRVHEQTVQGCKDVLERTKDVHWECVMREELTRPIRDVDLVVTVGGDGTLLQSSHFLDGSIPVLGVNSDPSRMSEVEERLEEFDATRSIGHLCGATGDTFEQVLNEILEGRREPVEQRRISTCIDGVDFGTMALNDVLIAHPNPAAVSRCTFSVKKAGGLGQTIPDIHCRSSGIRICASAGSTAAMQSAGGHPMRRDSPNLQYMVREPILPHPRFQDHLQGWVRPNEVLSLKWSCRRGALYFDGSHVCQEIQFGSKIEFSSNAQQLRIFLRPDDK